MMNLVTGAIDTAMSTFSPTQALVMLLTTCMAVYWFTHNNKTNNNKMKLPPGPPGYPIIGNLLEIKGASLCDVTQEWITKYGPVVKYTAGQTPIVVLGSIEAVTEAYTEKAPDFAGRPRLTSIDTISHNGSDIAFADYDDNLKYRRRVAMLALRTYLTGDQHTKRIQEAVKESIANMEAIKGAFNPVPYLTHMMLNILHGICFGYTLRIDDPTYLELLDFFNGTFGLLSNFWEDYFPFIKKFPTSEYKQFSKEVDFLTDYITKHVTKRRAVFSEDNIENLMDNILLAQKQIDEGDNVTNKCFTDLQVAFLLNDVFFAGVDTSRNTLSWIILTLAAHQDIQKKIHDEIDAAIDQEIPPGREHRLDLVYTEATIMEVVRRYPVVPMGLPHCAIYDTQVGGYDIPHKTMVMVNQKAILNDPRHWENPDRVIPERFIDAGGKKLKPRPKSWIPFSLGPRNCIGEFLARSNLTYSLAGLLQKLHFDLDPEMGEADFVAEDSWIIMVPKPYKVVVKKHKPEVDM